MRAMEIAKEKGAISEPRLPLGYGGTELAVVFERGCPNNSVPILWGEATTPKWMALFTTYGCTTAGRARSFRAVFARATSNDRKAVVDLPEAR